MYFVGRLSQLQLCCWYIKWKGTRLGRHAVFGTSYSSCVPQCEQSLLHLGWTCEGPSAGYHAHVPYLKRTEHPQAGRLCCQPGAVIFRLCECCQPDASCYDPSSLWSWSGIPSALMSAVYCAQAFLHPWLHDRSPSHPWTRTACWRECSCDSCKKIVCVCLKWPLDRQYYSTIIFIFLLDGILCNTTHRQHNVFRLCNRFQKFLIPSIILHNLSILPTNVQYYCAIILSV